MIFSKHIVRYLSVVLSTWILLYVALSVHYLVARNNDSLVLNGEQRLDNEQIIFQSMSRLKSDIFTNEKSGYYNNITTDLHEGNNLGVKYTNKVNSSERNILNNSTKFNTNAQEKKHTSSNRTNNPFKSVPSVKKTIHNRMENYSAGTVARENNKTSTLNYVKERKETNDAETKQQRAAKNDSSINTVFTKPGSNNESSSGKKEERVYKRKPNPNTYYSYSNTIITPLNHKFLVSNKNLCKTSSPELIVVVPSKPDNIQERTAIRSTYGTLSRDRKSYFNGINIEVVVRTVFIVGMSTSIQFRSKLFEESKKYGDIVIIDYIDNYRDLTKKVLHGLKWVNEFCSNVYYVMKADDDVFINVAVLTKRLEMYRYMNKSVVFGHIYNGYRAVIRTGKWAVTYEEFPLESYPDYMSGTSYTMTSDLIPKILYTAQRLPNLPIEDAFITGVIAHRIHNSAMVNWEDNSYWYGPFTGPCDFMTGHLSKTNMSPAQMYETWNTLISNGTKPDGTRCPRNSV